jgi:hypothetical protein
VCNRNLSGLCILSVFCRVFQGCPDEQAWSTDGKNSSLPFFTVSHPCFAVFLNPGKVCAAPLPGQKRFPPAEKRLQAYAKLILAVFYRLSPVSLLCLSGIPSLSADLRETKGVHKRDEISTRGINKNAGSGVLAPETSVVPLFNRKIRYRVPCCKQGTHYKEELRDS